MSSPRDAKPVTLSARIAALDEAGSLAAIRARVAAGDDPLAIIAECQLGMRYVGEHYESGRYFISGLIMAGEIFREAMEILEPLLPTAQSPHDPVVGGVALLCTVRGDIHDIGKSIVVTLLRSYRFTVHDLGVDVPPSEVARQTRELQPDVVGLSGLLTSTHSSMKETIAEVRRAAPHLGDRHPVIIIGGSAVDEQVRASTGADLWTDDAARGVEIIRASLSSRGTATGR